MKFFRAGKKVAKNKGFNEIDFVGRKDMSNDKLPWTKAKFIDGGNFNKDASERETVLGIMIEEDDTVAHFTGLVEGWQKRITELEELEKKLKLKIHKYEKFLRDTKNDTNSFLVWKAKSENSKLVEQLKKIVSDIKIVLEM